MKPIPDKTLRAIVRGVASGQCVAVDLSTVAWLADEVLQCRRALREQAVRAVREALLEVVDSAGGDLVAFGHRRRARRPPPR